MNVKDDVLDKGVSARSIINVKVYPEEYQSLIKQENIFPGWHMNKKSWISISLSDYFSDDYIESLIYASYRKINITKK